MAQEKYYSVAFHVDATCHVLVKASSDVEAQQKAWDEIDIGESEIGDPIEIVDCIELDKEEFEKYKK